MTIARQVAMLAAVVCVMPNPAAGQEIRAGGQVRPRWEYRNPFLTGPGEADAWVSMRVRGEVSARLERNVHVFVQVQDVRIWGEESNTLGDFSADNFDLHQGFVEIESTGPTVFAARMGRQEVNFGGQRLVGAVNWTQQARAFDGLRLSAEGSAFRLDLLGAVIADDVSATHDDDEYFGAAYGQLKRAGPGTLDLYGFYNRIPGTTSTDVVTLGARWWGAKGPVSFRAEGSYQVGERLAVDVNAFMVGARLGSAFAGGRANLTLWYDYLSGDDDPTDGESRVFNTLFATNHKFYGLADVFLDIPTHTAGRGLQDVAVKGSLAPIADVTFGAEFHSFRAAKPQGLATGHFGEEVDLAGTYRYSGNVSLSGGFSYVIAADGLAAIGRLGENASWVYVMVDARF